MKKFSFAILLFICFVSKAKTAVDIPSAGKTYLLIGQTFKDEYADYVKAMGKAPRGSSHYGEIFSGEINQGDDGNNLSFLKWISETYPNAVVQIAFSIKDNPASGGYDPSANPLWIHQACVDIAKGKYDDKIEKLAQTLKHYPTLKFLVRIGYEVSLELFAKCVDIDINKKYNEKGLNWLELAEKGEVPEIDAEAYKNAFRHVASILKDKNQNVATIFHPVRDINTAKILYPGDEYVDWCGLSVFNHDICWPTWEDGEFNNCDKEDPMDANFKKTIDWMKTVSKKPIIISESAVQSHVTKQAGPEHKIGYFKKIFSLIETYDISAFVYINSDWGAHGWNDLWGDTRVERDKTVFDYWKTEVNKPRYLHYPTD